VVKKQVALSTRTDARNPVKKPELEHWEGLLDWELDHLPNLKYILALGNFALHALTGDTGITKWRGSVFDCKVGRTHRVVKVVVTNNPAHILRNLAIRKSCLMNSQIAKGFSYVLCYPSHPKASDPNSQSRLRQARRLPSLDQAQLAALDSPASDDRGLVMFGVYFINHSDTDWTLLTTQPTVEKATTLMTGFREYMQKTYGKPPSCVAVSKERNEESVPRGELGGVT